jgi:uncharacterized protein YutE (UPF0331/DUF86 family)
MKRPITKLRIIQLETLYQKLSQVYPPKNELEEVYFVKHFEISFELITKTLISIFKYETNSEDPTSKKDVFRWANQNHFLSNPDLWLDFVDLRNRTVHDYLADDLLSEIKKILQFLPLFNNFLVKINKYLSLKP